MRTTETDPPWTLPPLSTIEREVLHWLGEGLAIQSLAARFASNSRTIERHIENILRKFGIAHRAPAVLARLRRVGCVLDA